MAQQFTITARFDANGAIRSITRTEKALDRLNRRTTTLRSTIQGVATGFATAFVALRGAGALTDAADQVQSVRNRLDALNDGASDTEAILRKLNATATKTRSDFQGTAEIFTRLKLANDELGRSDEELLRFTERLNKAIVLSGATAQESSAALIQLSQGLASGTLRGDELRSVLEQLPKVGDVIAKGLNATRGELKKLGEDGKISAEAVIGAFEVYGDTIDEQFGKTEATVGQALAIISNETLKFIDVTFNAGGVVKQLTKAFGFFAEKIKEASDFYSGFREQFEEVEEESKLSNIGFAINQVTKEIKELESREVITESTIKRVDELRLRLADLQIQAKKATQLGTNEIIDPKAAGEAAKQAAFFKQIREDALRDATRPGEKFALQQKAINELLAEGNITQGQANALLERYAETIQRLERGSVSAFQRRLNQLIEENNIRRTSITFGEIEAQILRRRLQLEKEGKGLSEEQEEALRRELTVRQDLIDVQERRAADADALERRVALEKEVADTLERQGNAALGLQTALDGFAAQANNVNQAVQNIANSFANNLTNTISTFITTGKASFKDFANSLIADISRIIVKLLVVRALSALGNSFGLGGDASAGVLGQLGGGLAGTRASGGPVNQNKSYLVGENGPEMFTPGQNGNITSNKDMMAAQQQPAQPPVTNLQVVNVTDPSMVPQAISDGQSDEAIINVLNRNADQIRSIIQ